MNYNLKISFIEKWASRPQANISVPPTETVALINGLRPVTTYQVRVFAQNVIGRSEPSEVIQLITMEESPGGPPIHIKAVAASSKSIKVNTKYKLFYFVIIYLSLR